MNGWTIKELECFTAVAEELSFTMAARRLHLSQPPLSRHIAGLEERLGCQLFHRTKRTVQLTEAGRLLLAETRGILPQLNRAEAIVREFSGRDDGRLAIGFVSALLSDPLVRLFDRFREQTKNVRITLHDLTPTEQLQAIRDGSLQFGFVGLAPVQRETGIALWPWRSEGLWAFFSRSHRLAEKPAIALSELSEESLVFVSSEAAPGFVSHLHELCVEAGFSARVVQEASRAQAVAMMALAGSSVALLPESVAKVIPGASARPLTDSAGNCLQLDFVIASAPKVDRVGEAFLAVASVD